MNNSRAAVLRQPRANGAWMLYEWRAVWLWRTSRRLHNGRYDIVVLRLRLNTGLCFITYCITYFFERDNIFVNRWTPAAQTKKHDSFSRSDWAKCASESAEETIEMHDWPKCSPYGAIYFMTLLHKSSSNRLYKQPIIYSFVVLYKKYN